MKLSDLKKPEYFLVLVASLGYFVDIYDLILFNIVKRSSLEALGFSGPALADTGIYLFNMQMTGMLVGGLLWGILGDTKGRLKVLFGSILMYSLANIANGFVGHVPPEYALNYYAVVRFLAGVGLAGELGAGITLVSETLHKDKRGYGTMMIVSVGALGAVLAYFVAKIGWEKAYFVGGGLGLGLLALRVGTLESKMFKGLDQQDGVKRGAFLSLFTSWERFIKYLGCIMIGLPVWFIVAVLVGNAESFAKAFGNTTATTAQAVMYSYIGLAAGDLLSGLLSQLFRTRRKVVLGYMFSCFISIIIYLYFNQSPTDSYFYFLCFLLGAATGYWALFVTIASEQFGTNIRSTVTNTVPNFVRGAVVPITLSYTHLVKGGMDIKTAAMIVGCVCLGLAILAVLSVKETFSKDLDYIEVL